jgi:CubicO group peptidase (beta-lactamase class C family)
VALAASDRGILYTGAFGRREIARGPAMTLDTIFRIASMTKALTSLAALQLVEQRKIGLDDGVGGILAPLARPQVLEGFDADGSPRLRPARRAITLRHLLTHTSGFCYETWNADLLRYVAATGMPSTGTGKLAAFDLPLLFDPGERWEYGIGIDWVGRLVEALSGEALDAYIEAHICGPLGMRDTGFVPSPAQRARQASVHLREADGGLAPQPIETPHAPEFFAGGGGLYSSGPDYLLFLRMLLADGLGEGGPIVQPQTVRMMALNHIGELAAGVLKTSLPARSNDVDFFPGSALRWGLGTMINEAAGPDGRRAGTLSWAGLFNTYFWIDRAARVTGVILTQILPFADERAVALYGAFERAVYAARGG